MQKTLNRVIVEGVAPEIDCGRFPVKRTVGEPVIVEADIFTDGHDSLAAELLWRPEGLREWSRTPMVHVGNDRWRGELRPTSQGRWLYTVEGWVDRFETWRRDLAKRLEAGQDVEVDLEIGAAHLRDAAGRASAAERRLLAGLAASLAGEGDPPEPLARRIELAQDDETAHLASKHADLSRATRYGRELSVQVDRERARFSAWYEMFPRSAAAEPGRHGTFDDVRKRLDYVAKMGFDVLYLPPIHPIGETFRKGKNNAVRAEAGDVGSPWAIGGAAGGHKAIHPELGTEDDFERLVEAARAKGIEIALDIAFQASPDHPYVEAHPDWFVARPDGTIQYAENPPKKYQDIYPFDFESDDHEALWDELLSIFFHWIDRGVKIFRVDNPHTKPFAFWEWAIAKIKDEHPDVLFLSEAFTRPKVMYRLAKLGFTQSYNYFPWRNGKDEIVEYFTELTRTEVVEFFRPNLWPNTPDILTEHLQMGGRPAFVQRLVLASTLGASYGIYGPPFEQAVAEPLARGKEEYRDSEKYEIHHWDLEAPGNLSELVARMNRIRRDNPALQSDRHLAFHSTDNPALVAYSKTTRTRDNTILVVVNLDPHHRQSGWVGLDLAALGLQAGRSFEVHDLVTHERYHWSGPDNYVELDPGAIPAHVFRVRPRLRSERDFDYYA